MDFVFFGTPVFALAVLDELERSGLRPRAVVCQPDRPRGRGRKVAPGPVRSWADARGVEVLQPVRQKDPEYLRRFEALAPDLALVAAFGQLLTRPVLAIPRLGFVNVHPSLVPRYRGAAPIQWTLIHGDTQTGVSILTVTPRFDDGEVLAQRSVEVGPDETTETLGTKLGSLGGRLAAEVMARLAQGPVPGVLQDDDQVVWAPALDKSAGLLDWTQSALALHNRIRGVQPWPGAATGLGDRILKIHRARMVVGAKVPKAAPGEVVEASGDRLVIQTGDGLLGLLEVQLEGKRRMSAQAFVAGRQIQVGQLLH